MRHETCVVVQQFIQPPKPTLISPEQTVTPFPSVYLFIIITLRFIKNRYATTLAIIITIRLKYNVCPNNCTRIYIYANWCDTRSRGFEIRDDRVKRARDLVKRVNWMNETAGGQVLEPGRSEKLAIAVDYIQPNVPMNHAVG